MNPLAPLSATGQPRAAPLAAPCDFNRPIGTFDQASRKPADS